MPWSRALLSTFLFLPACGSSTGPSTPSYQITVAQTAVRSGVGGDYLRDVTLHVTGASDAAAGVGVNFQFTAGSVAPLPLVTNPNGDVTLTWTIPAELMLPGRTHSLGFCAHASGGSCSIDLNNEPVVRVTF
jgi:hypothetical protein